jgi:hypothetical protein
MNYIILICIIVILKTLGYELGVLNIPLLAHR